MMTRADRLESVRGPRSRRVSVCSRPIFAPANCESTGQDQAQEQPFQVLALLLERRAKTVTRDGCNRLWTADTFVIRPRSQQGHQKIREALGDSARPRFCRDRRSARMPVHRGGCSFRGARGHQASAGDLVPGERRDVVPIATQESQRRPAWRSASSLAGLVLIMTSTRSSGLATRIQRWRFAAIRSQRSLESLSGDPSRSISLTA
jgi:hypothetical protein